MGECTDTSNSAWCEMPVPVSNYAGDDGPWLVHPDPDWPGHPARPPGCGWVWVSSATDILRRFGNLGSLPAEVHYWWVERVNIEMVAAANPDLRYEAVHERLYDYGVYPMPGMLMVQGSPSPGRGMGIDVEGRGGAWVRRIEPLPDDEDDTDG